METLMWSTRIFTRWRYRHHLGGNHAVLWAYNNRERKFKLEMFKKSFPIHVTKMLEELNYPVIHFLKFIPLCGFVLLYTSDSFFLNKMYTTSNWAASGMSREIEVVPASRKIAPNPFGSKLTKAASAITTITTRQSSYFHTDNTILFNSRFKKKRNI